ncbi:hypothetical protein [Clostridium sp. UBA5712]|uniref:hypothetical protein n=1 Tax=Clostridium sp. UBA5712 TaxID=1946368 RepID=UPI0032178ECC
MKKIFKVVRIISPTEIVINAGSNEGILDYQRFLVYSLDGEEIIDPDTGKSLGNLEIVKGTGIATFVHEKMCTITSDMYSKYSNLDINLIPKINSYFDDNSPKVGDEKHLSFKEVTVGDFVKAI